MPADFASGPIDKIVLHVVHGSYASAANWPKDVAPFAGGNDPEAGDDPGYVLDEAPDVTYWEVGDGENRDPEGDTEDDEQKGKGS